MKNKKKLVLCLTFISCASVVFAEHRYGINADNISIGKLAPARVDPASYTLLGPSIEIEELSGGASTFLVNATGVAFSSHIADGSIGGADIAAGSVGGTQTVRGVTDGVLTVNPGILRASHTVAQAFGLVEIGSRVIVSSMIAESTYISSGIANISRYHLKLGETGGVLEDRTSVVYSSHIVNESILSEDILNSTIQGIDILDDTLAAVDIQRGRSSSGMVETGPGVIFGSMTARGINGGIVEIQPGIIFSSMASGNWTSISSFTITGASLVVNGISYAFPSTAPAAGQLLRTRADNTVFWGGDLDTSGLGSGVVGSTVGINPFRVTVGTLGALNVDIASNTEDGLVAALDRVGAAGMTTGTSVQATIVYKEGLYQIKNATIPAGIKIWSVGGSSKTVWQLSDGASSLVTVYGEIDGITFSSAASSQMVLMKSSGTLRNFFFINGQGLNNAGDLTCQLCVLSASNVYISNGLITDFVGRAGFVNGGDAGAVSVRYSNNVVFDRVNTGSFRGNVGGGAANFTAISFFYSEDIIWKNSHFNDVKARFFLGVAGRRYHFINNTANVTGIGSADVASRGYFSMNNDHAAVSSACFFTDNVVTISTGISSGESIFSTEIAAAGRVVDLNISGNKLIGKEVGNSITGINLQDARSLDAVFQNNYAVNISTFLSDTGVRTEYRGLGNVLKNGSGIQKF